MPRLGSLTSRTRGRTACDVGRLVSTNPSPVGHIGFEELRRGMPKPFDRGSKKCATRAGDCQIHAGGGRAGFGKCRCRRDSHSRLSEARECAGMPEGADLRSDPITLPQPKPGIISVHFVVPLVGGV